MEAQESGWLIEARGKGSHFDRVVMAATPKAALAMLEKSPEGHRRLLAETRYASTINVSFRIPKETLGRTHCFYVSYRGLDS